VAIGGGRSHAGGRQITGVSVEKIGLPQREIGMSKEDERRGKHGGGELDWRGERPGC